MRDAEPPVEPQAPGPSLEDEPPSDPDQLPPARSVQTPPSLWWWFLVLAALIGVWVLSMLFMRGPLAPPSDDAPLDGGSAGASP